MFGVAYSNTPAFQGSLPPSPRPQYRHPFFAMGSRKTLGWRNQHQTTTGWWFEPLWKIWKSIGMIIPNRWENKKWQPNHQPALLVPNTSIFPWVPQAHHEIIAAQTSVWRCLKVSFASGELASTLFRWSHTPDAPCMEYLPTKLGLFSGKCR